MRKSRDQARFISAYADSLIAHAVNPDQRSDGDNQEDFHELVDLVRTLSEVDYAVPPETRHLMWRWVIQQPPADPPVWRVRGCVEATIDWVRRHLTLSGLAEGAALAAMMWVVIATANWYTVRPTATDIVHESSSRAVIGQGFVLVREWRTHRYAAGFAQPPVLQDGTVREWIEGGALPRTARWFYRADGRLLSVFVSLPEGNYTRASVYYTSDHPDGPRGVLLVQPNDAEYRDAVKRFPKADHPALARFFQPAYPGAGVASEQAFNRALAIASPGAITPPEMSLSATEALTDSGQSAYLVVGSARRQLWFDRDSEGALRARLARVDSSRYVAKDSFFTLRFDVKATFDGGHRELLRWEAVETKVLTTNEVGNRPFELPAPPRTPVRRLSASQELTQILPVLRALRTGR